MAGKVTLEDIVSLAKRRGFIYQGSDIYGGLAGTWDYGPHGVALKRNIMNLWWKMFVEDRDDMYGVDPAILMNSKVWEASGHVTGFNDPLVECEKCHSRLRQDHIENQTCPVCGTKGKFSAPRQFNMMFKTSVGPVDDKKSISYLRPENAQGIFTNYKNVLDTFSPDLPFGIATMGRAFRNEISPREFIFRVREFDLMEFEYFIPPKEWKRHFDYWHQQFETWIKALGLDPGKVQELEVPAEDRAHYSKRTVDFEYKFPFGTKEIGAIAYRTDFDLKNHMEQSGVNMEYTMKGTDTKLIPHVIEPTFGVDRHLLAVLSESYSEDTQNGEKRIFLKLPAHLAPVKVAVSPLLKNKPELVAKAREVYDLLKKTSSDGMLGPRTGGSVAWDDNGNIGKRYRRQDEIGTPYCVTIDFDTLTDDTVTVRDRDTTKQERVKIEELIPKLS